jgi:hypothetical protein
MQVKEVKANIKNGLTKFKLLKTNTKKIQSNTTAAFAKTSHMILYSVGIVKWLSLAKIATMNGKTKKGEINAPNVNVNIRSQSQ